MLTSEGNTRSVKPSEPKPTPKTGGFSKTEYDFLQAWTVIQARSHATARDKGFWDEADSLLGTAASAEYAKVIENLISAQKIALIHSEISEALEGNRKSLSDDKLPNRPMEEVELADAVIRIMDYAEYKGYDIAGALIEKAHYNAGREYKHGKEY